MRFAAGGTHRPNLIVQALPIATEHHAALDDDVDFARAVLDRRLDFRKADLERREAVREGGGDSGHRDICALEGPDRGCNEIVVHADRRGGHAQLFHTHGLDQIGADGIAGLGAEAFDTAGRVI